VAVRALTLVVIQDLEMRLQRLTLLTVGTTVEQELVPMVKLRRRLLEYTTLRAVGTADNLVVPELFKSSNILCLREKPLCLEIVPL
jgi:hypothetical protein